MKKGTTRVRKLFKCGAASYPLCSFKLSQFTQKTDPKKRTLCPGRLHHGLASSSNTVLLLQFSPLFPPLNSVSRRARGQGSICTHHFLQRRQPHGLWGKWLSSHHPYPVPWWCELLPAKQLTFQTYFLNFIKPFISDLSFGPCFTFHNTYFIIYHSFTFQLRTLAVCKSYPDGGVWNKLLKLL